VLESLISILNESTAIFAKFSTSGGKREKKIKKKEEKEKKDHSIATLLGASQLKTDICLK